LDGDEWKYSGDPRKYSTAGDFLPDGWKRQYGLTVTNQYATKAAAGGMTYFEKYIHGCDPRVADTDGDGVPDIDEIPHSPGSDPTDPDDGGDPANCVTVKFTVGDPSSSQSERWDLYITNDSSGKTRHVCNYGYGTVTSQEHPLVKGKSYTYKLVWTDTNRGALGADYDWQFLINDSTATGLLPALYGTGFFHLEDPDGLLTQLYNGDDVNMAKGKTGKIYVPCVIEASSPVADNSPQRFSGFKTNFGDPCSQETPGQALAVFYSEVENPDYSIKDFSVDLNVCGFPDSMFGSSFYAYWSKVDGPNSGSLSQSVGKAVTFQNPKDGGLYKFECDLVGSGYPVSGANVLLPLGGPDVTDYFMSEVARYDAWYIELRNRSFENTSLQPEIQAALFLYYFRGTMRDMGHSGDDYVSGNSPCKRYCNHTVTISEHVFGKDQIGNFLYAYCCAKTWLNLRLTQFASHVFHVLRKGGKLDDPEDIASMAAGYQLGMTPNADFKTILETCGTPISAMQSESAKRGWPSTDVGAGRSDYPAYLPPF
ncbi:MAG: hypothetical protein FWG50_10740, partial [Kiritimatiellaeota bacterium]|nr:hypothetical protein [Kiritimatiellota bacterium]